MPSRDLLSSGSLRLRAAATGSLLLLAIGLTVLSSARGASAGGSFERIVAVGADGASRSVTLSQSGPRSEAAFQGSPVAVPAGGYVRLYPWIGWLPAIPGRYYPRAQVLCLYWHEPVSNCVRLSAAGRHLLLPFAALRLRTVAPTTVVAVRYRSHLLRFADGNVFAALELALERPPYAAAAPPANAVRLTVRWRGPGASRMPATLWLAPNGVYATGQRYNLPQGPWCYLAGNLPDPTADLIEATARVCRVASQS